MAWNATVESVHNITASVSFTLESTDVVTVRTEEKILQHNGLLSNLAEGAVPEQVVLFLDACPGKVHVKEEEQYS